MPQCQFLFSAVFVFQKSYTRNILEIGRNEAQSSYFSLTRDGVQSRDGGGPGGGHTTWWHVPPLAAPPWCPLTSPLHLYKASDAKTLNQSVFSQIKFHSAAAIEDQFRGTEVVVPTPCRDGELPPEPSPSPSTPPPSPSMLLAPMMRR
jgi:hypothetical protein